MLSTLNSMNQSFVSEMDRINQRLSRATNQLSTGIRVGKVSDQPDSVSSILQVRADLASNEQTQSNLARAKSESDGGEQALQSAVSLLENTRVLGAQGQTGTATAESRQVLSSQVGSIMEQMVGLTRTSVEGRYIFSGDSDQVAPYSIDLTATPPVTTYAGSDATRQIEHPNGTRFTVAHTAQTIFDSTDPATNVFQAMDNLRTSLLSNDQTAIGNALSQVSNSLTYLNGQLAFYGTVQNKVAEATTFASTKELQLKTHLDSLQNADMTQAVMDLSQAQLEQTAALQAQSKVPRSSLFDYLG